MCENTDKQYYFERFPFLRPSSRKNSFLIVESFLNYLIISHQIRWIYLGLFGLKGSVSQYLFITYFLRGHSTATEFRLFRSAFSKYLFIYNFCCFLSSYYQEENKERLVFFNSKVHILQNKYRGTESVRCDDKHHYEKRSRDTVPLSRI